jgi:hypothetical protein
LPSFADDGYLSQGGDMAGNHVSVAASAFRGAVDKPTAGEAEDKHDFDERLAAFVGVASTLAETLEACPETGSVGQVAEAVRLAFGGLPEPRMDEHRPSGQYRVARDIATHDCEFALWAARRPADKPGPDLICQGYARWIREELALLDS